MCYDGSCIQECTIELMEEQFYLPYRGNDLHAILLTEKQLSIIEKYYKNKSPEFPDKP